MNEQEQHREEAARLDRQQAEQHAAEGRQLEERQRLTLVCALSEGSCRRLPQKHKNAIRILCFMRQSLQQDLLSANLFYVIV